MLAAAALALHPSVRLAWRKRSPLAFYTIATVVMWLFSLGPSPTLMNETLIYKAPYAWLMLLPGVEGVRVPARFWVLSTLCLAVAGGLAVARITTRWPRLRTWLPALVCALVVVEAWPRPIRMWPRPESRPAHTVFNRAAGTTDESRARCDRVLSRNGASSSHLQWIQRVLRAALLGAAVHAGSTRSHRARPALVDGDHRSGRRSRSRRRRALAGLSGVGSASIGGVSRQGLHGLSHRPERIAGRLDVAAVAWRTAEDPDHYGVAVSGSRRPYDRRRSGDAVAHRRSSGSDERDHHRSRCRAVRCAASSRRSPATSQIFPACWRSTPQSTASRGARRGREARRSWRYRRRSNSR